MANGHGGARRGAGHPKGVPGGRTAGAARVIPMAQTWEFAERALQYADEMLQGLVKLACTAESEAVRHAAMNSVLDRALGKAPQHIDVTALRHTEIHYRTIKEIREACIERGVAQFLLEHLSAAGFSSTFEHSCLCDASIANEKLARLLP